MRLEKRGDGYTHSGIKKIGCASNCWLSRWCRSRFSLNTQFTRIRLSLCCTSSLESSSSLLQIVAITPTSRFTPGEVWNCRSRSLSSNSAKLRAYTSQLYLEWLIWRAFKDATNGCATLYRGIEPDFVDCARVCGWVWGIAMAHDNYRGKSADMGRERFEIILLNRVWNWDYFKLIWHLCKKF